jgi:hypothetical protein
MVTPPFKNHNYISQQCTKAFTLLATLVARKRPAIFLSDGRFLSTLVSSVRQKNDGATALMLLA